MSFNDGVVQRVEIRVPPGPSGLLGFQLAHSEQVIIPYSASEWIVTDNEVISWPLEDYPVRDGWEMWTYNLDVYEHSVFVRFLVSDDVGNIPLTIAPIVITPLALAEIEPIAE